MLITTSASKHFGVPLLGCLEPLPVQIFAPGVKCYSSYTFAEIGAYWCCGHKPSIDLWASKLPPWTSINTKSKVKFLRTQSHQMQYMNPEHDFYEHQTTSHLKHIMLLHEEFSKCSRSPAPISFSLFPLFSKVVDLMPHFGHQIAQGGRAWRISWINWPAKSRCGKSHCLDSGMWQNSWWNWQHGHVFFYILCDYQP